MVRLNDLDAGEDATTGLLDHGELRAVAVDPLQAGSHVAQATPA
jgi:hypothetical protein